MGLLNSPHEVPEPPQIRQSLSVYSQRAEIAIGSVHNATVKTVCCEMNFLVTLRERRVPLLDFLSVPFPIPTSLPSVSAHFLQWKTGFLLFRGFDSQLGANQLHVILINGLLFILLAKCK